MERETKEFKREGYSFVLNCWLTAQEVRDIELSAYEGLKFNKDELENTLSGELLSKIQQNTENKTIERYVISFNGDTDNILKRLLESRSNMVQDIMTEIKSIEEEQVEVKKN